MEIVFFNMGHSSNSMRKINPDITESVHFDLCAHKYVKPNFDMYADNYKNAELVCGNSLETVPQYIQNNLNKKFDVVHVDGGHSFDVALGDIKNACKLVKTGGPVIIDDCDLSTVNRCLNGAVKTAVEENIIKVMFDGGASGAGPSNILAVCHE